MPPDGDGRKSDVGGVDGFRDLLAWGVAAYPMRYQPLTGDFAFEKDSYVAPDWSIEDLEMVANARRVIGYGGAFPPYEGLFKKFAAAKNFHEAFGLRPRKRPDTFYVHIPAPLKKKSNTDGFELKELAWDLMKMGQDHQFPTKGLIKINGQKRASSRAACDVAADVPA